MKLDTWIRCWALILPWAACCDPLDKQLTRDRRHNDVMTSLLLVSDDAEIFKEFANFFWPGRATSATQRGQFIIRLRDELYASHTSVKPDEIPYVSKRLPGQTKSE